MIWYRCDTLETLNLKHTILKMKQNKISEYGSVTVGIGGSIQAAVFFFISWKSESVCWHSATWCWSVYCTNFKLIIWTAHHTGTRAPSAIFQFPTSKVKFTDWFWCSNLKNTDLKPQVSQLHLLFIYTIAISCSSFLLFTVLSVSCIPKRNMSTWSSSGRIIEMKEHDTPNAWMICRRWLNHFKKHKITCQIELKTQKIQNQTLIVNNFVGCWRCRYSMVDDWRYQHEWFQFIRSLPSSPLWQVLLRSSKFTDAFGWTLAFRSSSRQQKIHLWNII